jgi:[ribosomal protein S5]-alanine N-acetyltransferase
VSGRVKLVSVGEGWRERVLDAMRRSQRFQRPWVYPPTTNAAYDRMLERQDTGEFEGFLLVRRGDDELLGMCNLSQIFRGNLKSAYIGFGAVEGFAGQGYMREGVSLVIDRAFGPLRLHRLEANIQPANERSKALVRDLGFVQEGFSERYLKIGGRWRDHERWAIRTELWRPNRP